jgi:hypothetical protein
MDSFNISETIVNGFDEGRDFFVQGIVGGTMPCVQLSTDNKLDCRISLEILF